MADEHGTDQAEEQLPSRRSTTGMKLLRMQREAQALDAPGPNVQP